MTCFIIAEAGANFRILDNPNANYKHALKLIDIAVDANADAVKFQVYRAKSMYVEDAGHADYIGKTKAIFNIIKEMELPYEWLPKLKAYCDDKGIEFLATPFDIKSADELEKVGIKKYKLASYSITDFPLLKHVAMKNKPILLSTGASELEDIKKAVDYIKKWNQDITLLQCTAKYPAPLDSINLRSITRMQDEFSLPVGLSDHSREPIIAPLGALALGASVIEKHFTTDNDLPGPDHGFAILPEELELLVTSVRQLETALGKSEKIVSSHERELYEFARHFLYAAKPIKKGETLTKDNIAVLRPGKKEQGLSPTHFDDILGKKAIKDLGFQEPITKRCFDE